MLENLKNFWMQHFCVVRSCHEILVWIEKVKLHWRVLIYFEEACCRCIAAVDGSLVRRCNGEIELKEGGREERREIDGVQGLDGARNLWPLYHFTGLAASPSAAMRAGSGDELWHSTALAAALQKRWAPDFRVYSYFLPDYTRFHLLSSIIIRLFVSDQTVHTQRKQKNPFSPCSNSFYFRRRKTVYFSTQKRKLKANQKTDEKFPALSELFKNKDIKR